MSSELAGKVIFLTGGASGIGRVCALAYAQEGARVAVVDIDRQAVEATARELGTENGLAVAADMGNRAAVDQAVQLTIEHFGRIDAVHNNVGIPGPSRPLDETSEDEWDLVMRINLKSVYLTTTAAIEALKASRGCILNTASMVGLIGQDNHAAYVASKGGMIALTKAMAIDYAQYGIRVNAICPAGVWTPMLRTWAQSQPNPEEMAEYLDHIHILGYCPEADVIADAAVFLLSNRARFITGEALPVSGGAALGYRR
jgi:meso-butanediol dehydrogenase / (S,S)-butanediol dehydrogenase / diacetyl reductase